MGNTDHLEVFPKATQIINDALASNLVDRIHASPARTGGPVISKFDTVLIRRGQASQIEELTRPSYGVVCE